MRQYFPCSTPLDLLRAISRSIADMEPLCQPILNRFQVTLIIFTNFIDQVT